MEHVLEMNAALEKFLVLSNKCDRRKLIHVTKENKNCSAMQNDK